MLLPPAYSVVLASPGSAAILLFVYRLCKAIFH